MGLSGKCDYRAIRPHTWRNTGDHRPESKFRTFRKNPVKSFFTSFYVFMLNSYLISSTAPNCFIYFSLGGINRSAFSFTNNLTWTFLLREFR